MQKRKRLGSYVLLIKNILTIVAKKWRKNIICNKWLLFSTKVNKETKTKNCDFVPTLSWTFFLRLFRYCLNTRAQSMIRNNCLTVDLHLHRNIKKRPTFQNRTAIFNAQPFHATIGHTTFKVRCWPTLADPFAFGPRSCCEPACATGKVDRGKFWCWRKDSPLESISHRIASLLSFRALVFDGVLCAVVVISLFLVGWLRWLRFISLGVCDRKSILFHTRDRSARGRGGMAAGGQARFGARRLAEGKSGPEVALLILGRFFSVVASRVKHVLDSYLDFFFL